MWGTRGEVAEAWGDVMRRVFAAGVLMAIALVTGGCSVAGTSAPPAWESPGVDTSTGVAASTPDVCARIRGVISADMTPLGKSLGTLLGYAIAKDTDDQQSAQADATAQVKAIGADIAKAASSAADPALRIAVASARKSIDDLADDPTFLSDVTSISDITEATGKLTTATQPVVAACQ